MRDYQICTNCVMDTTDPDIQFDDKGICNHCTEYYEVKSKRWLRGEEGKKKLEERVAMMKEYGKNKEYDCIIGLSGGVDSAYLAYLGSKHGLRMLAVHVDAGWNSELAVKNIENICNILHIDLITEVIDWSVMKELQYAFLKSGFINQDVPQDHAFFAALYTYAEKNKIKYVLNGTNISTENTLPKAWSGWMDALDDKFVKSVYKKVIGKSLKGYPLLSYWKYRVWNNINNRFAIIDLLNNVDYNKDEALDILKKELNFQDYGAKHNESRFTKFHQNYFLVEKFGYEKRKAHLASLVLSEAITRDEALQELNKPLYPSEEAKNQDIEYIAKKLGIRMEEFHAIMKSKPMEIASFKNSQQLFFKLLPYMSFVSRARRKFLNLFK